MMAGPPKRLSWATKTKRRVLLVLHTYKSHYLDTLILDRWHGEASVSVHDEVLVCVIIENLSLLRIEAEWIRQKMAIRVKQARHGIGLERPLGASASGMLRAPRRLFNQNHHLGKSDRSSYRRSNISTFGSTGPWPRVRHSIHAANLELVPQPQKSWV